MIIAWLVSVNKRKFATDLTNYSLMKICANQRNLWQK